MKYLISLLLAMSLIFTSCAPDIPITADEVTDLREKLDMCVNNLDEVEVILADLLEELKEYLNKQEE